MLIISWDIGGAHLKSACFNQEGVLQSIIQLPCPIWQGTHILSEALGIALREFSRFGNVLYSTHLITMTAELSDIFATRRQGVQKILSILKKDLSGEYFFYTPESTQASWLPLEALTKESFHLLASMNWHASARFIAQKISFALLIDMGSTTTDFVTIDQGKLSIQGFSDAERLYHKELLYTGVVRTPLMALGAAMEVNGREQSIIAEHFATTADIYRALKKLPHGVDQHPTADRKPKTAFASARRVMRMVGQDFYASDWQAQKHIPFTNAFINKQKTLLKKMIDHHLSKLPSHCPIIAIGCGEFLIQEIAREFDYPYLKSTDLLGVKRFKKMTTHCLPVYALVQLFIKERVVVELGQVA